MTTLNYWVAEWGVQNIDFDLLRFIKDEVIIQIENNVETFEECCSSLIKMLRGSQIFGMPSHQHLGMEKASRKIENFNSMVELSRNSEEALLVGFSSIYSLIPNDNKENVTLWVGGHKKHGAMIMLSRLQRYPDAECVAMFCLSDLDFSYSNMNHVRVSGKKMSLGDVLTVALHGKHGWVGGASIFKRSICKGDLSRASFKGASLVGAMLEDVDLTKADLTGANLFRAILSGADLTGAILLGAHLQSASIRGANLAGADLRKAILSGTDLAKANLQGANLSQAALDGVNFNEANLFGANFEGANLENAGFFDSSNLSEAIGLDKAMFVNKAYLPNGWSAIWRKKRKAWDITMPHGPYIDPRERK